MTTLCCGNCKWWDDENTFRVRSGRKSWPVAECLAPLPVSVRGSVWRTNMAKTDGTDCPCFSPRTEPKK